MNEIDQLSKSRELNCFVRLIVYKYSESLHESLAVVSLLYVHFHYCTYVCKITVVGEGDIDHGNLRKEFFRILAHKAPVAYMSRDSSAKYTAPNVTALQV